MTIERDKSIYTPMMQQYLTIKEHYEDTLVFFRLGDFYELFFEDAFKASRILEIALTGRDAGVENRVPMCGVPYHAVDQYIQRLVDAGEKVAIVEQVEDPKLAKGIVKRDVIRLITPGTVMDQAFLDEKSNHFIASVSDLGFQYSVNYCDLSTGETFITILDKVDVLLVNELLNIKAKEIVISQNFPKSILENVVNTYHITLSFCEDVSLNSNYAYLYETIVDSRIQMGLNRLVNYLVETQKRTLNHIQIPIINTSQQSLMMDVYSKKNLELFETLRNNQRKGSLLWLIDEAQTAMGSRLIRHYLDKPLINRVDISKRYDVVQAFRESLFIADAIKNSLKNVYDLERLVGRIAYENANPKDLLQLKRSLKEIPLLKEQMKQLKSLHALDLNEDLNEFTELTDLLDKSIHEDAPFTVKDGGVIKDLYDTELDRLRDIKKNGQQYMANLVTKERERTGIKNLKVGFNKVFGYYIEITRGNLATLPEDLNYERKQTLANAERFITPELKEMESMILNAEEKSLSLEYELFVTIRNSIKKDITSLQKLARQIAELDALLAFSIVANIYHFVRPTLVEERKVHIKNGRHPIVETLLKNRLYVENDIDFEEETNILLITGPNMSGKSTYMRQMALTVLLAQIGSFVPCDHAELMVFDKIFTRIGATDDLISGQSTFMIEMMEANNALKNATPNSLILFDEIGRGTATFDGMALAQAIIEYIHERIGAKTLFSTHYHELTILESNLPHLRNIHVRAEENGGELTFLHKVQMGPSDKSYGIQVAKLADLPPQVIKRSEKILTKLEHNKKEIVFEPEYNLFDYNFNAPEQKSIDPLQQEVLSLLETVNVFELTPLEALNTLYKIQNKLKKK